MSLYLFFTFNLSTPLSWIGLFFAQTLTIIPHLSLGGLYGMVYEHFLNYFILENPSLRFSELFQATIVVAHGDILKSMALMLGAGKLLAMARDSKVLHLISIGKMFSSIISFFIVLQLQVSF
jgi:hypothetical protein